MASTTHIIALVALVATSGCSPSFRPDGHKGTATIPRPITKVVLRAEVPEAEQRDIDKMFHKDLTSQILKSTSTINLVRDEDQPQAIILWRTESYEPGSYWVGFFTNGLAGWAHYKVLISITDPETGKLDYAWSSWAAVQGNSFWRDTGMATWCAERVAGELVEQLR
ncbi:MAG: hypothetical protein RLZZ127_1685 [Planctomycetota bacterium]|jgi:hypothetical protein